MSDISIYFPTADIGGYFAGDMVHVEPAHNNGCSKAGFAILNVTNLPNDRSGQAAFVKSLLEGHGVSNIDGISKVRLRMFFVDFQNFPPPRLNDIQNNRSTSMTWGQAKRFLRTKIIIDDQDSSQDSSAEIQDEDV